jgi:hypothetical protein
MKRRDRLDGIYNQLLAIKNDNDFLAAVSATPVKTAALLGDFRYKDLHSRVYEIQKKLREKNGSGREKKRVKTIKNTLKELFTTEVTPQKEQQLLNKIFGLLNHDIDKDYKDEFYN